MTPEEVKEAIGDVPHMSLDQARRIKELIDRDALKDVLELGFAHGVSSCYIAAAVAEHGGTLTTIDQESAKAREPNIFELLDTCGLRDVVTVHIEPRSFTWRLMRMLEDGLGPRFDLVYLDGGHSWDVTGYAFFLVDRLLRPGGWLLFDDIHWTYDKSPSLKDKASVRKMPEDFRTTPQVKKVFELLVEPHPDYTRCRIEKGWGYAQKRRRRSPVGRWLRS